MKLLQKFYYSTKRESSSDFWNTLKHLDTYYVSIREYPEENNIENW